MVESNEKNFLHVKGYENLNDIDSSEFEFIYNYEKHIEKKTNNILQYKAVEWNGDLHYSIIMEIFSGLKFVRMESNSNNFSEYHIFPILEYKSKNFKIDKTPTIVIKKIKKQCELYLTANTIPIKYSHCFNKLERYKGKLKWVWNGDFLKKEDIMMLKEIIELFIKNPHYIGEFDGIL